MTDAVDKALKLVKKARRQTVDEPFRNAFPGIYGNPKEIAEQAAQMVGKEDPALKRLFGVTRDELYEMSAGRKGTMAPDIARRPGATGSAAADRLMNRRNAQRLIDVLGEAGKHPGLQRGMDSWYTMDPVYQRIRHLVGDDAAPDHYRNLNSLIGMMSPGSEVETEINRGLAAHYLDKQNRLDDFIKHGGTKTSMRGPDFPADLRPMIPHPYHGTSQAGPLKKYIENGRKITSDAPKVPLYVQASGVPETGQQTRGAVPDAHFTRALGMADTREGPVTAKASMKMHEYQAIEPWFRDKVAKKVGLEAVPAQARLWGAMGKQTGVTTSIGAPKIELLAKHIMKVAKRHKITPEVARDLVLTGGVYYRGGTVRA